jgi:glycosyltransferase involved in cell wall biosynthesis
MTEYINWKRNWASKRDKLLITHPFTHFKLTLIPNQPDYSMLVQDNKIALVSYGYLFRDPRILTMARSLRGIGFEIICINLSPIPFEAEFQSILSKEFECHNIVIPHKDVVSKRTREILTRTTKIIKSKLQFSTKNGAENGLPEEFKIVEKYIKYAIHDKRFYSITKDVKIFFGCEMFWGSFAAYFFSKAYNRKFIFDIKELYHDMDPSAAQGLVNFVKNYENLFFKSSMVLPCVSQPIIDYYIQRNPRLRDKFVLLPNTPSLGQKINPSRNIGDGKIGFVFLAGYAPQIRGIEFLLTIWERLAPENAELHLYLARLDSESKRELEAYVTKTLSRSIFFHEPVSEDEIIATVAQYDIGVIPYLPNVCLNHLYCSPGKFGQYLKAGLAIMSSDTKNITQAILREDLGYVYPTDDLHQAVNIFRDAIRNLDSLETKQANATLYFQATFNWETFFLKFVETLKKTTDLPQKKNILVLHYVTDSNKENIPRTVIHNLESFSSYSRHRIDYFCIANLSEEDLSAVDFSRYDCLVMHYYSQVYSVLPEDLMVKIREFNGKKIFFAQDDYDHISRNRKKYTDCKIDILFSPVSNEKSLRYLYPDKNMEGIQILHYLTGYSQDVGLSEEPKPIRQRSCDIFYRGNDVGWAYGRLGHEKQQIGIKMKEILQFSSFNVDIECSISKQIYGNEYFRRMGNAKATLVTESGSSIIFDSDDFMQQKIDIITLSRENEMMPEQKKLEERFPEFFKQEGQFNVAEISPKVFEAINCKTAIIAYEGHYSGVLIPGKHFIPLKKDYSNIEDVLQKLSDHKFLQELVDTAYSDIIASGLYSYQRFIENFDQIV